MAAIGYLGAQHSNASVAGLTQTDTTQPGLPSAGDVAGKIANATAGLGSLESWLGGGSHPETTAGLGQAVQETQPPVPIKDLEVATDSVRGKLGGLYPRIGSTVGPGPAGASAQIRSTWGKALKRLGL